MDGISTIDGGSRCHTGMDITMLGKVRIATT
jgi:hypothetical protein